MADRRQLIEINRETETKWWESSLLPVRGRRIRQDRLRRTLEHHILPVLQNLESFYLRENLGTTPRIHGKSFSQIEKDDVAIEAALYLFDLAVEEGLITFGAQQKIRNKMSERITVGACGLSIKQVKKRYIKRAISLISEKTGLGPTVLKSIQVDDVKELNKIRMLGKFGAANMRILSAGLDNNLSGLFARDEEYLQTLHRCCEMKYLRAMRYALGNDFPDILEWRSSFVKSIADDLTHRAQIMALGTSLNKQPESEVVSALSRWHMDAMPRDDTDETELIDVRKTRIGQIKSLLDDDFDLMLEWNGATVDAIGHWQDRELKMLQPYLKYLDRNVMHFYGRLPPQQVIEILQGLWNKLGKVFFDSDMREPGGLEVAKHITKAVVSMNKRQSTPSNLTQAIVSSGIFDTHMNQYIKNPSLKT